MKRKWSERPGDEFTPAPIDSLISVSFSAAADRGRELLETLLSFKSSLKHWPTAHRAENGRTPGDSCGLRISAGIHFNELQKCNGIPVLLRDEEGNVIIIRFIKDCWVILVPFWREQLCICYPMVAKPEREMSSRSTYCTYHLFIYCFP